MPLNRRELLAATLLAGCAGSTAPVVEPDPVEPPAAKAGKRGKAKAQEPDVARIAGVTPRNLLVVIVDDLRWDTLSCLGHPIARTPNIDRLAREGVAFPNMYVTTSLCSPSRATMLTGMYAHHHGVMSNGVDLGRKIPTYGTILQKAGYETAYIGKWHMGDRMDPRPGWDHWVSFKGQGQYDYPDGQKKKADERGFNVDGTFADATGYVTDLITDRAEEWLRGRDGAKPWLMVVSHKAVHAPLVPPVRYAGEFTDVTCPAPMPDTDEAYAGKPKWLRAMRDSPLGVDGEYHGRENPDEWYRNYFRCLLAVDDSMGRLYALLEQRKEMDDTAIVFISDNGFMLGEKGVLDKRCFYEDSCKIPLLVRCPGVAVAGARPKEFALNVDLAPTLLELAGVAPPEEMHGRSLVPVLAGKPPADWRTTWLYEYFYERIYPQTPTVLGVRSGKWKLVTYHGVWEDDELFDLDADPREEHNLANELPDQRKELLTALRDEANRLGCRLNPWWGKVAGGDDDAGTEG